MNKIATMRLDLVETQTCHDRYSLVGQAAHKLSVTCQELFRKAYVSAGYTETYARAVFILYVDTNRGALPPIVRAYSERIAASGGPRGFRETPACLACTRNEQEWPGLVFCYRMIEPAVTKATLLADGSEPPPARARRTYRRRSRTNPVGSQKALLGDSRI